MNIARCAAFLSITLSFACADQQAQPSKPPAGKPQTTPQREPTLDELLGLTKPGDAPPPVPNKADSDLDRALRGDAQVDDDFVQAVSLMERVAGRLSGADPGVETQRLQDEILRKLDKILDDAQKQQSSSSSSTSQQQQQQQQQQQRQSSQQQQQGQQQATGENATTGPGKQEGELREPDAGASAAWGDLPPHVRDALMQGFSDRFSAMYERLTREYYQRLAEDEARTTPESRP